MVRLIFQDHSNEQKHVEKTHHVDFRDGVDAGNVYAHSHDDWGTWRKKGGEQKVLG